MDNNLEKMYPDLVKEWSERNFPMNPGEISYGSNKLVWWKGECGHEWQASPHSRTGRNSTGCPYCSGNRILPGFNDLTTRFPEIAKEWSDRNLPLRPNQVTAFSNRKAWWKGKCGHEWYALISSRSAGHGCPYCEDHKLLKGFNDFASKYPKLAEQWSDKNKYKPEEVTPKKSGLFWWRCPSCGKEYKAWISSRIEGSKCPYCSGRVIVPGFNSLTATHPEIASEWDYEKNGAAVPETVSASSKKFYWWKSNCGHEWKARIYDRTMHNITCPKCEQEFIYILPRFLILLYAGRNHMDVLFDFEKLIGISVEIYIPELQLVIEHKCPDDRNQKQKVKACICNLRNIQYIMLSSFTTAEETAKYIREILKKNRLYIMTEIEDDISLCREKYQLLKRSGTYEKTFTTNCHTS